MKSHRDRLFEHHGWRRRPNLEAVDRRRLRGNFTLLALEKLESRTLLAGDVTTAIVTELPTDVDGPLVRFDLKLTDAAGAPVATLVAGQEFVLEVFVEDLRGENAGGVFAGFLDIEWDSSLAVAAGPIRHTAAFANYNVGELGTPGLVDEAGAVSSNSKPTGAGPFKLMSVPLLAIGAGEVVFTAEAADESPMKDTLLFGWEIALPVEWIEYGSTSVEIEGTYDGPIPDPTIDTDEPDLPEDDPIFTATAVGLEVVVLNPDGTPAASLAPGQPFVLQVLVTDVRALAHGVFAGFLDITWDPELAVATGAMEYGAAYPNGHSGDTSTPGLIDEAGAVADLVEVGTGALELFRVPMQAVGSGELVFTADAADIFPIHDVLVYRWNDAVPPSKVYYGGASITVVAEEAAPPLFLLLLEDSEGGNSGLASSDGDLASDGNDFLDALAASLSGGTIRKSAEDESSGSSDESGQGGELPIGPLTPVVGNPLDD
jgi:hypothetical protein